MNKLAGLILAGGKSSRMGTNKSLLTLPDSQLTLLEHCQKQLAVVCQDHVFISSNQQHQGIADIIQHCGPLSGIHAVITQIEEQHTDITELIVLAVDMPDIRIDDLHYLIKMGRKDNSLCCFENCFLPLYIPLSIDVSEYLKNVLQPQTDNTSKQVKNRQYSVKNMLNALQGSHIPPLKDTQLDNINTPVQWQQRCTEQAFTPAQ